MIGNVPLYDVANNDYLRFEEAALCECSHRLALLDTVRYRKGGQSASTDEPTLSSNPTHLLTLRHRCPSSWSNLEQSGTVAPSRPFLTTLARISNLPIYSLHRCSACGFYTRYIIHRNAGRDTTLFEISEPNLSNFQANPGKRISRACVSELSFVYVYILQFTIGREVPVGSCVSI